jgi:DNA-binding response OmpR family regulator
VTDRDLAARQRDPAGSCSVLVMEPDRDVRDLLTFAFERAGLTTQSGLDGSVPPAAIVSGLRNGHRSLRQLRDRVEYRDIPLIEVAKPFSPRELVARVRTELARRPTPIQASADGWRR